MSVTCVFGMQWGDEGKGRVVDLLSVESDVDDALLIGRRGETRAALEHLVQRLAIPRDAREVIVRLDVNGYWERRIERLRAEALDLAATPAETPGPRGIDNRLPTSSW